MCWAIRRLHRKNFVKNFRKIFRKFLNNFWKFFWGRLDIQSSRLFQSMEKSCVVPVWSCAESVRCLWGPMRSCVVFSRTSLTYVLKYMLPMLLSTYVLIFTYVLLHLWKYRAWLVLSDDIYKIIDLSNVSGILHILFVYFVVFSLSNPMTVKGPLMFRVKRS